MGLTRLGAKLMANSIMGLTTCSYTSTGAMMVIGCSTAAFSSTSTWLGSSGAMATMDMSYPTATVCSTGVELVFRATYGTAAANKDWNEWGVYNASASGTDGTILNRKLEDPSLGTKTSAQTWQFTVKVVVSAN